MFYVRPLYQRRTTEEDYNTRFDVSEQSMPCGRENECTRERSRDVQDVVDKKEAAFSFVLYKILDNIIL